MFCSFVARWFDQFRWFDKFGFDQAGMSGELMRQRAMVVVPLCVVRELDGHFPSHTADYHVPKTPGIRGVRD